MEKNKQNKNAEKSGTDVFVNARHILVFGIILTVIVCFCAVLYVYVRNYASNEKSLRINLYYINDSTHMVEPELRNIIDPYSNDAVFNAVANEFMNGSKSTNQTLELPAEVQFKSAALNGKTAYVDLTQDYDSLPADKKMMSLAAVVYTFTELDFVDNVEISVEGKPLTLLGGNRAFDRENVKLNPAIDPEKKNWQLVKLYFCSGSSKKLSAEERTMEVKQSLTLEYQIVDQLISGPENTHLKALVPAETKIKDIKTEDGICYVNLSKDFVSKPSADAIDNTLLVYSIVNSLTELDYVNRVQFLIEGEKVDGMNGDFDFSKPFARNLDLIE